MATTITALPCGKKTTTKKTSLHKTVDSDKSRQAPLSDNVIISWYVLQGQLKINLAFLNDTLKYADLSIGRSRRELLS